MSLINHHYPLAASRIGYYLSADAAWDSADILLSTDYFGSLLPGQSQSFSQTLTLPKDLPVGQQYIIFYADYADNVLEANESNNQASVSIQVAADQSMTVLTPNAATSWPSDRQQTIQWISNLGGTVKIDLYKSISFNQTIATAAANTGFYIWTVPELQPEDHYWIKITSNADSSIFDDSDRFSITWPETLTMLSPANGDVFGFGTNRNIIWKSSFNGTVNIDLLKAGNFYRSIEQAVQTVSASDNSYSWHVPADLFEGEDYQIRVTHSADPATTDLSDGYFTLADSNAETPLAVDDAAVTKENVAVLISVLTNDNPPAGETLEVIAVSDPAHGTALINGDNTLTYTPDFGFTGSDSFTYTVKSPSRGAASASVYVTVQEEVNCDSWALPPDVQALARDDAGNIFAVGTFKDSITLGGETLTAPVGMPALYIAKYTSSGSLLWTRKAVAGEYGIIEAKAAVDTTGNLYLSGSYYSAINFYTVDTVEKNLSGEPGCGHDIFVVKYSPAGELAWAERAGGQWDDYGESLAVDSAAGRLHIGGMFTGTLNLGSGASATTLNSIGNNTDPFLAQYTLDGTLVWAKQVDGGSGSVLSVAAKGADSVLATGYYEDSITFSGTSPITLTTGDATNFFVAEFRADSGDVRWAQKANGTSNCTGRAVAADDSGAVYVAGDFRQSCDFYDAETVFKSLASFGVNNDMFMIKYHADGTPEWLRQGGGASYDFGRDVTFDQDNNPLFIGTCDQYPVSFTIDAAGNTAISNTSCAAVYDRDGSFQGFAEPGDKLVLAETATGNPVIIGREGKVTPCGEIQNTTEDSSDSVLFTNIAAGSDHVVALDSKGNVWTWGRNDYGQVGDGSFTDRLAPFQVHEISDIVAITAGAYHTLALDKFGSVWAWGANSDGLLGNGTQNNSNLPVRVLGLTDIIAIAAGSHHSIALKRDGTVWTWGMNSSYQLGHGPGGSTDELLPGQVPNLFSVIGIAGGYNFTAVLKADKTVWSWGKNDRGQLGTGDTADSPIPTAALLPANVAAIYGTLSSRAFAVMTDGSVWGWGYNSDFGAIGNNNGWDQPVPVKIFEYASCLSGGQEHTIALATDGSLWAWGRNMEGEYGTGTTSYSSSPIPATDLENVTAVAAGSFFTAALKKNGTVWCWGTNWNGQLGNNTTQQALAPVQVMIEQP